MSDLTPEDVDLKLTSVHEKLNEEDMRLWEGLEDEKISRIAGDEANKKFTLQVQNENQGTESRLSTEIIHRSEGDLVNVGSLNALAQAMSEYRIKTDLELANEAIARQQLGVTLDTKINNFVASWDHTTMSIYSAIQAVQDDVTMKNYAMDMRIRKYEDMLQDITTDSIQITMDNGEINMGAWTILSQAREWDLEILGKFKDYKVQTDKDINDALEDIQNQLPVKEEIIKEAIEALSNAPIIKELENEIGGLEVTIDGVSKTMMEHRIDVQNEMINLSKELGDKVTAETNARVDALNKETTDRINEIQKETAVRTEQFRQLDDGLTVEIQERIDGDNKAYELIENLKASNETNLADVYQKIAVNTSDISANASKIEQITAEVQVAQGDANQALVNAATALQQANAAVDANKATAERVDQMEASIETIQGDLSNKVDATAFNNLKAEVTTLDGKVTTNAQNISSLQGTVSSLDSTVSGHTSAINNLQITQTQQGNSITQISQNLTSLKSQVAAIDGTVIANSSAISLLQSKTQTLENGLESVSNSTTQLENRINNLAVGGRNYILNTTKLGSNLLLLNGNDYHVQGLGVTYSADSALYTLTSGNSEKFVRLVTAVNVNTAIKADTSYTVSADIKGNVGQLRWRIIARVNGVYNDILLQNISLTAAYTKSSATFKVPTNTDNLIVSLQAYTGTAGSYFDLKNKSFKMEEGTIPTDWTPAPEDVDAAQSGSASAIAVLQAQVTSIDGRVTANSNSLTTLTSTVNNNYSEMINNYSTKANVDEVVSNNIQKYDAQLNTSLPTTQDATQVNMWLATELNPENRSDWDQNTIPDYSWLRKLSVTDRRYLADGDTLKSGWWINRIVFFRTIVSVTQAKTINLGNFTGDDGHAIYVNQKRVFGWAGYATNPVSFELSAGVSIIDIAVSNGIGGAGFSAQNLISNQVDWMRAPISPEIQASGAATAVTSIQAQVTNIDGRVTANSSQITTLNTKIANGGGNLLKNSDFSTGNTNYWSVGGYNETSDVGVNALTGSEWWVAAGESKTFVAHRVAVYGSPNYLDVWQSVPVEGGKTYQFSAYTGSHRVVSMVFFRFFDVNGTDIGNTWGQQTDRNTNIGNVAGGRQLNQYKRIYQNITVPSNCTRVDAIVRCDDSNNDPYLFLTRAMVCQVEGVNSPLVPWSESASGYSSTLQVTNQSIDGVKAVSTVSVDNNGFISGYGLISQLVNGVVTSAFGVDADYFYVGKSMSNAKKPFMVLTSPQTIGGVSYPAGVWMDVAVIANATIGTAHIRDASITNAKIVDLNADKITAGTIDANRIGANSITAEKLLVGMGANLWGDQYFTKGSQGWSSVSGSHYDVVAQGNVIECSLRDHIAPRSLKIPMKKGETYTIEITCTKSAGADRPLNAGFWLIKENGDAVPTPWYGIGEMSSQLIEGSGAWYRKKYQVTVDNGGGDIYNTTAAGLLYFQIPQSSGDPDMTTWLIGNVTVYRTSDSALIVNGAITADKLYSREVSGMFASFGTMTTYKNTNNPNGARMVMSGSLITVYDDNNKLRVKLGVW